MNKFTEIKAGYRLTVHSWENDGDHSKTTVHDGLSHAAVKFFLAICKLHGSSGRNQGFGNMYEPDHDERMAYLTALAEVCEAHPVSDDILGLPDEGGEDLDLDNMRMELVHEYLGCSEDFFTRVYSGHAVDFVEETIRIPDVTHEFR